MTLVLIWDPNTSSTDEYDIELEPNNGYNSSAHAETTENEENKYISPLVSLAILQGFRMLCSFCVIIKQDKYHFNRFCYRLASFCGFTLIVWFFIRVCLAKFEAVQTAFFFPVSIIIMMGFTGLPLALDIIQLCQSADSYSRIKNPWALACAIFVENLVHMFLIIQLDMIFGIIFVFLVNGFAMVFFSHWLLKNMPNVVAVHPITVAIVARYPFKNANDHAIHI